MGEHVFFGLLAAEIDLITLTSSACRQTLETAKSMESSEISLRALNTTHTGDDPTWRSRASAR
jgi:hypothetical protein